MNPFRVLALCVCTTLGSSCAAARDPRRQAGGPEAERAAAARELRRMFPGIEGEITRETIAAELERERVSHDPSSGARAGAIEAIEKGDFDRARDLLCELLAGKHIDRARVLTDAGDARAGLAALDRALEMAPRSASILCLRGEAALAIPDQDREPALRESALANFFQAASLDPAKAGARAWLGASRAARGLGRPEEAREYARRGLAALSAQNAGANADPATARNRAESLHRSLAEASFDDYLGAKNSGAAVEAIQSRARASRDALEGFLGRTPEDAWPWEHLAELAQSQGSPTEARDLALRGLRIVPADPALLERLALASRAVGGAAAAVEVLEPFCRRHPEVALGARQLALALFDAAIEDAERSRDPRANLAASEAAFARCRGMDGRNEADCRALEAQCRGALGFWLLARDDLEGAHKAFLSMQDAVRGGLALEIRGTRRRGTDGLFRVAEGYGERGDPGNPGSIDSLEQAARICNLLHEIDPGDARFAAASGRFNRDTAVALELEASSLADRGKSGEAGRLLERARELMETAFSAWRDAAALAPDEERPAAQAGAVLARYLQRDAEAACSFLEQAVKLGEHKVVGLLAAAGEKGISEIERQARRKLLEDEETLVGDACKDLGLVHLELLGDPSKAREWLERGRKAGPDPRPEIDGLLDRCQKAQQGEVDPRLRDEDRWAPSARSGKKP